MVGQDRPDRGGRESFLSLCTVSSLWSETLSHPRSASPTRPLSSSSRLIAFSIGSKRLVSRLSTLPRSSLVRWSLLLVLLATVQWPCFSLVCSSTGKSPPALADHKVRTPTQSIMLTEYRRTQYPSTQICTLAIF